MVNLMLGIRDALSVGTLALTWAVTMRHKGWAHVERAAARKGPPYPVMRLRYPQLRSWAPSKAYKKPTVLPHPQSSTATPNFRLIPAIPQLPTPKASGLHRSSQNSQSRHHEILHSSPPSKRVPCSPAQHRFRSRSRKRPIKAYRRSDGANNY